MEPCSGAGCGTPLRCVGTVAQIEQVECVSVELVALGRLGRAVLTCCQRKADKQKNLRGGPNLGGGADRVGSLKSTGPNFAAEFFLDVK